LSDKTSWIGVVGNQESVDRVVLMGVVEIQYEGMIWIDLSRIMYMVAFNI
jgi:hypothetical protein